MIRIQDDLRTIPSPRPFGHHDAHALVPFRGRHDPYHRIHRVRVQQRQPLYYNLNLDQYDVHPNEALAIHPQSGPSSDIMHSHDTGEDI